MSPLPTFVQDVLHLRCESAPSTWNPTGPSAAKNAEARLRGDYGHTEIDCAGGCSAAPCLSACGHPDDDDGSNLFHDFPSWFRLNKRNSILAPRRRFLDGEVPIIR